MSQQSSVMKKSRSYLAVVLLALAGSALADKQSEIEHLLSYVENSGCKFERNGDRFDSRKAREHIQRKYDYVMRWASSRIQSTEDFIELTATESSMSGKKYYVNCDGESQTSSEWLLEELSRYRKTNS
jgi:hypothetical protein